MLLTQLRRTHRSARYFISLITLATIFGCTYAPENDVNENDRHAKIASQDSYGDSAERVVYPQQNWNSADSLWFYNTPQGSTLIPYDIFLHLETADSQLLFRSDENINRLRYLPQLGSSSNPDALPVGWVKDEYQGKTFIGFTCAACHTSQINYQGVAIRIDGGTTLADMEQMLKSLAAALQASLEQPEKFDRLAQKVLQKKYPAEKEAFKAELAGAAKKIAQYNHINEPLFGDKSVAYGYARLDAFGRIYNRILEHLTPNEANSNPANAPVSYPQLWDTPQHDFVQWNGVGDNEASGPLERNVGEALGVFAHFDLNKQAGDAGYRSSVILGNLVEMEQRLASLWSPSWDELAKQGVLPAINQTLANEGQQVFVEYQCDSCHKPIVRTDPNRRITAQFSRVTTIGTDPVMVSNALMRTGKMGVFTGQPMNPRMPTPFPETGSVLPALSAAVAGVIEESKRHESLPPANMDNPIKTTARYVDFEPISKYQAKESLSGYKARPLNGIWATAPYLHNGSVPSLYELFMPSCSDAEIASGKTCRPNRFTLGVRELDAVKVGFVQRDPAQYPGLFVFDTSLPSNSNKGHEFTAGITPVFVLDAQGHPVKDAQGKPQMKKLKPISDHQRLALVEYLKTL